MVNTWLAIVMELFMEQRDPLGQSVLAQQDIDLAEWTCMF